MGKAANERVIGGRGGISGPKGAEANHDRIPAEVYPERRRLRRRRAGMTGIMLALGAALLATAAAAAQYETPANPPEPGAQLAELIEIYDSICLRAFPDDSAVARAMTARGASAMGDAEIRIYLHDDPGQGWNLAGRTARFQLTVETGPYHACGVRTMTAAGFPDMGPYRALADRFEAGGGFQRFGPQSMEVGNVQTTGGGERRQLRGATESLMVLLGTPTAKTRDSAHSAVEVRFVHQIYAGN